MKVLGLFIILVLAANVLSAQNMDLKVSVLFTDTSLETVLVELSQRFDLRFSYSKEQVPLTKKITISGEEISLKQVLEEIGNQAIIQYQLIGDQIVFKAKNNSESVSILKGKIIDMSTNAPLAFASISISGSSVGAASNTEGDFVIRIPDQYKSNPVIISYIGYKPYQFSFPDPGQQELVIELEEDVKTLNTVVVEEKPGPSILEEAIARIRYNYDINALVYTFFVREHTFQDNKPVGVSEAEYQAYRGAVPGSNHKQVKLIKGRRSKDYASYQKILSMFPALTGFEVWMNINSIFNADLALPKNGGALFSPKFLRQHQFELLGQSVLNGKDVYVVTFDQRDRFRGKALYKGKLYIDTETLAFVRIESELSPKGVKNAKFIASRAVALLFGFGENRVTGMRFITDYKELRGKWYVSSIKTFWDIKLSKKKRQFASKLSLEGDLVITDLKLDNAIPFPLSEVMTFQDFKYRSYMYDNKFWDGYNAIPTDSKIEESFKEIEMKNRNGGFNKNFWKRYKPFKNNPPLLDRMDSIYSNKTLDDNTDSASAKYLLYEENKLVRPKFQPLSQSFSTRHFVFYYAPIDSSSAVAMSSRLENSYDRILKDFRLQRITTPIKVEVYPGIKDYHFAIGKMDAPDSEAGMAIDKDIFKIVSPRNPGSYHTYETIMKGAVHEFAHCVHYNFIEQLSEEEQEQISNGREAPWLFEAIASYVAGQFYHPRRFDYLKRGQFPSIKELNKVDQNGKVYDIGFIIIEFIAKTWGKESVINLLKQNGNIKSALGIDEADFEIKFHTYLKKAYLTTKQ